MQTLTVSRRRQVTLVATALIVLAIGLGAPVYDGLLLAALVLAGGLVWSGREWKTWALAIPIATVGLAWSSIDPEGCSIGSKGRIIYEKLVGHVSYVAWSDVARQAFSRGCYASGHDAGGLEASIQPLGEKTVDGRKWERFRTKLGNFWIPAPGRELLGWLVWEITVQRDYESGDVAIRPGDTVFDCGAHVGVFTRYALSRGAAKVVAVEPDPVNIAILEANFEQEIAAGRVILVKAGVWDRKDYLDFNESDDNSARHSFVTEAHNSHKLPHIPVLPLDEITTELGLDRVDFIKMDIEGAERRALVGSRQTIARFQPRMAICTYHLRDDATVIPALVKNMQPGYRIHAKDIEIGIYRYITKVMFFSPDSPAKTAFSAAPLTRPPL